MATVRHSGIAAADGAGGVGAAGGRAEAKAAAPRGAGRLRALTTTAVFSMAAAMPAMAADRAEEESGRQSNGAQLAQAEQAAPMEIPAVTVEGTRQPQQNIQARQVPLPRIPTTVQDTPQTVSVVTEEQMRKQNLVNLRDVVLRTPGITMHAGEGGGSQPPGDSFNLRGFTTQNDIFVDGIRDIGIANRDTFNLESVEIFKGPSGSFFGRGSGGGTINLTTKKARLNETFNAVTGSIGTDDYYRGTVDINTPITDNAAFRLNAVGMDRDYAERDVVHDQRFGIAPTLTMALDDDTMFRLSYLYQKDDNDADNGVPWYNGKPVTEVSGVSRNNFYGFTDNFEKTETNRITAEIEHDFSRNLRIANTLQAAWYEIDRWNMTGPVREDSLTSLYPGGLDENSFFPTVSGSHQSRGQESWAIQNRTTLGADFETGWLKHEMTASLDLTKEHYDTQRYTMRALDGGPVQGPDLNVFDPDYTSSGLVRERARRDKTDAESVAVSLYDRVEFAPGFYAIGNVRYERYEADSTFTNPDGTTAQPDGSTEQDLFTYQVGLQYKPTPNQTYYVAHGISELPTYDAGLGYGEIMGGNDDRDPQRTKSFEIGAKVSLLDNRLGLGGAVFWLERKNQQDFEGEEIVTNDYKRIVKGFELQVDGRLTDAWTVSAGYAYLDSEVDRPDDPTDGGVLGKTPKHSGFVWTDYDVMETLNVGAGVFFTGKRYGGDGGDKTDGNYVPSQWQLDAAVNYQLTDNINLQLNGINLTNEVTYDRIHPGRQAHLGLGRTVIFTTGVTF